MAASGSKVRSLCPGLTRSAASGSQSISLCWSLPPARVRAHTQSERETTQVCSLFAHRDKQPLLEHSSDASCNFFFSFPFFFLCWLLSLLTTHSVTAAAAVVKVCYCLQPTPRSRSITRQPPCLCAIKPRSALFEPKVGLHLPLSLSSHSLSACASLLCSSTLTSTFFLPPHPSASALHGNSPRQQPLSDIFGI